MDPIAALDHVPVIVADYDAAVRGFTALLGRRPNWQGRYPGARHAWFQLANLALDVIAADGEGGAGDEVRARLDKYGEGPSAIGWRTADLDESARVLTRRGVELRPPATTRSLGPDGSARDWRIALARASTTRGLAMFWVEQAADAPAWPISPPVTDAAAAVAGVDHLVVRTNDPEAAVALYGARLGLDLRLDRANPAFGARLLFFRCGDAVVEISAPLKAALETAGERDRLSGLAWRVTDAAAAQARLSAAGIDVSEVRTGRKPGTQVFTVRGGVPGAPFLMIQQGAEG